MTTLTPFNLTPLGLFHTVVSIVCVVLVLAMAALAGKTRVFGRASAYVETISYSTTVLLLMIPTVTETLTRVPPSAPWVASPEASIFPPLYSMLLVVFLIGVSMQARRLHAVSNR